MFNALRLCAIGFASLSILLACQAMTRTSAIDPALARASFCQIAKPLSYSRRDTAETREQITEHNCVGHALCGWNTGATVCPASP